MPVIGDDARPGPEPGNRNRRANPRGAGAPELGLPPANTAARPDDDIPTLAPVAPPEVPGLAGRDPGRAAGTGEPEAERPEA